MGLQATWSSWSLAAANMQWHGEKQQVFVFLIINKKLIMHIFFRPTFFTFFMHANTSNIHIIGEREREREREISVYEYTG